MSTDTATINRSQSLLLTKGRIPVLAPARADRARLETLLSDVWTRESLPFPGMTVRARNEHLIRTSAHSVIRKLSVTSITSTFAKRSASLASIPRDLADDESAGEDDISVFTSTHLTTIESAPAMAEGHLCAEDLDQRLSAIDDDGSDQATASTVRARSLLESGSATGSRENSRRPRERRRITKKNPTSCQSGILTPDYVPLSLSPSPSTPVVAGALRSRSANGPNLKRQASLLSRKSVRSVCSAVDSAGRGVRKKRAGEHLGCGVDEFKQGQSPSCPVFTIQRPSTSPDKPGLNRWSKADVSRRGIVSQGFRGFFR